MNLREFKLLVDKPNVLHVVLGRSEPNLSAEPSNRTRRPRPLRGARSGTPKRRQEAPSRVRQTKRASIELYLTYFFLDTWARDDLRAFRREVDRCASRLLIPSSSICVVSGGPNFSSRK